MLTKIISGHQTGAGIAAIDAARDKGFPCGGWVPKRRMTENGPLPDKYIVDEMDWAGYPQRTRQNVVKSDGTVIFINWSLPCGSMLTRKYAMEQGKPCLYIDLEKVSNPTPLLKQFIVDNKIGILNVAGSSASNDPHIYDEVYRVIEQILS